MKPRGLLGDPAFRVGLVLLLLAGGMFGYAEKTRRDRYWASLDRHRVPVVVAAVDMPSGFELTPAHVAVRECPPVIVAASAVKPQQLSQVVTRRLRVAVRAGDPLLWWQLESR